MIFYVLYYEPLLELVGPFAERTVAVDWALAKERKRERPTLWTIKTTHSPMPSPYELTIIKPEDVL